MSSVGCSVTTWPFSPLADNFFNDRISQRVHVTLTTAPSPNKSSSSSADLRVGVDNNDANFVPVKTVYCQPKAICQEF
jgi:hypothetical protein